MISWDIEDYRPTPPFPGKATKWQDGLAATSTPYTPPPSLSAWATIRRQSGFSVYHVPAPPVNGLIRLDLISREHFSADMANSKYASTAVMSSKAFSQRSKAALGLSSPACPHEADGKELNTISETR